MPQNTFLYKESLQISLFFSAKNRARKAYSGYSPKTNSWLGIHVLDLGVEV